MKLTKFVHACLLAQTDAAAVLFDPGKYSWESGVIDVSTLPELSTVVITHEHADHFHPAFVEALHERFPEISWVASPAVATQLKTMGIQNVGSESVGPVRVFSQKPHVSTSPLNADPPVENVAVHFADMLTVGGDRHDLEESRDVLALTIIAPWGSECDAARMLLELKPKYVLPVHDWHWNEVARAQEYDRFETLCEEHGIRFLKPIDGKPIEI